VTSAFERLADQVEEWRRQGVGAVLARVAEYRGFGGARRGELLAINARGQQAGDMLRGAVGQAIREAAEPLITGSGATIIDVPVRWEDAVAAGLSCGGRASVILANVDDVPDPLWSALRTRTPLALAVHSNRPRAALLIARGHASVGSHGDDKTDPRVEEHARELLEGGV